MRDGEKRIALLIDAENAAAADIDAVLAGLTRHGTALVRRAYGNWSSGHKAWEDALKRHAIRPMQQFPYVKGKNAADIAMVVDAMDLLHSGSIDAFALVSSDSDFTPLAMHLVSRGAKVHGFGRPDTPEAFINACSHFTRLGGPANPAKSAKSAGAVLAVRAEKVRNDMELHDALRRAVTAAIGPDGWANLAQVGSQIQDKSFHQSKYGYAKLKALISATEIFEIRQENGCQVRHKRARAA
jgi:uncharacterized protein (TIGR00288 family)